MTASSYTAGQTVDFTIDIRAPHTGVAVRLSTQV